MSDNIKFACVAPQLLEDIWRHVGGHLLKGQLAINGGDLRVALVALSDVLLDLNAGRAQLWVAIDNAAKRVLAAMISEILDLDGHLVVWVKGMGGEDITRWGLALSDVIAEFAKAEGCQAVRFVGRKGLLRAYSGVEVVGLHDSGLPLYERRVA